MELQEKLRQASLNIQSAVVGTPEDKQQSESMRESTCQSSKVSMQTLTRKEAFHVLCSLDD